MSEDTLLEKIKNRQKQEYLMSPREDNLLGSLESKNGTTEEEKKEDNDNILKAVEELEKELGSIPPLRRHSSILIDSDMSEQIFMYCRNQGITFDAFIEGVWEFLSANQSALNKVAKFAKTRHNQRKKIGTKRRLLAALKKV